MNEEKKANPTLQPPVRTASEIRPIRLVPSSSDYATFVKTTVDAMGLTGPIASKTKPSESVLSLVKWKS